MPNMKTLWYTDPEGQTTEFELFDVDAAQAMQSPCGGWSDSKPEKKMEAKSLDKPPSNTLGLRPLNP